MALGALARLETPGADAHAPGLAGDLRPYRDEVRKPPALRELVRVADRMTHRGALPADIAPLRHERSSEWMRSEEHTSELQSLAYLVCRLLLEKKKTRCHERGQSARPGRR